MSERPATERETIRETTGTVSTPEAANIRERDMETATNARGSDDDSAFLPPNRMSTMRERWTDVQAEFVDDPRSAVQDAHELVTQLVTELTETFTRERSTLERQWTGEGNADTEDLRVALQRYRAFFNRLLTT